MTDQTNKDPLDTLACPFCGSNDISDGEMLSTNPAGGVCTQSMCHGCGALGPEAQLAPDEIDFGDEKAIAAWNRRASASEADQEAYEQECLNMTAEGIKYWKDKYEALSATSAPAAGSDSND